MLNSILKDTITIVNQNGNINKDIKASVQKDKIIITDVKIPVEVNDLIIRRLPSGIEEKFKVIDPQFTQGSNRIPSYYSIIYEKKGHKNNNEYSVNNQYILNGQHSKINIKSTDNSINNINTNDNELFNELKKVITTQIKDKDKKIELLQSVEEMKNLQNTDDFTDSYKKFMSQASNHITVFGPFLGALSGLLVWNSNN